MSDEETRRKLQESVTRSIIKAKQDPNYRRMEARDNVCGARADARFNNMHSRAIAEEDASGNRYKG